MRGCSCRGTAGFVHVSCLAEQAKILFAEVEESNLGYKVMAERWTRWNMCSLCEQEHHGVVHCALGWACWKTYVGRPEGDRFRRSAMTQLGNGLSAARHYADALSVMEAEWAMKRRFGASELDLLVIQGNLAATNRRVGRDEEALCLKRDVYSGRLRLNGEEHEQTLVAANNYAGSLIDLQKYEECLSLLRKTMPVARRVLGESHDVTLRLKKIYAQTLCEDPTATLGDFSEAVTTHEEVARTARRVLGGAHPFVELIERALPFSRALLHSREMPRGA